VTDEGSGITLKLWHDIPHGVLAALPRGTKLSLASKFFCGGQMFSYPTPWSDAVTSVTIDG
jgi:hypothetical protein